MKLTTKITVSAITLAITAGLGLSQERGNRRGPDRQGPPPAQEADRPARPERPPVPPLLRALDANHDGEISAEEIEQASSALKTLDANGDGKLTRDEIAPPRPPRREGRPPRDGVDRPDGPPQGPPPHNPRGGPRPPRPRN